MKKQVSMVSITLPIEITLHLKGLNRIAWHTFAVWRLNLNFNSRVGWLVLILLFTYFTLSICINQVSRFVNDPFIFTVKTDYNSWSYNIPSLTICSDYMNDSFVDEIYQRFENVTSIAYESRTYRDYYHYMKLIGSLNAENIHLIDDFENTKLFKNLTGEEIFNIALNVWTFPINVVSFTYKQRYP